MVKPVVIEGFLLSVSCPTEERLSVLLDATDLSWSKYRNLIIRLEDELAEIDEAYKKRETRGRGLRARHRRISYGKKVARHRRLKFMPYPSRFANILRKMRRDLYFYINRECMVLQIMQYGAFKRNVYILPYPRAAVFMAYLEELNKTIRDLNSQIVDYRETGYYTTVRRTLKNADLNYAVLDSEVHLPKISVDLTPLRLDPKIIEELVESRYKESFEKISEEEKRGLEALRRELENKRRDLIIKSIETLRDKTNEIVKKIVSSRKVKGAKQELERLRNLATEVGLEAVATSVLTPLVDVIEHPEKAEEVFGTTMLSEAVNGRIAGLISSI